MKKSEVIALFGSQSEVARALKITRSAVSKWGETIPKLRGFQIESMSISNKNLVKR